MTRCTDGDDSEDDDDKMGSAVDMDAFISSGALEDEDPNRYIEVQPASKKNAEAIQDGLIQTRTYDLHITYDKYYQVFSFSELIVLIQDIEFPYCLMEMENNRISIRYLDFG